MSILNMQTLNVIAIVLVYVLIFHPRFNQWPKGYASNVKGKPSAYIDPPTFIFFSIAYMATFVFFAFALSQLPNFKSLIPILDSASGVSFDLKQLGTNFTIALVAITILINNPRVAQADGKWRSYLLNVARIPRQALVLKNSIYNSLNSLDHHWAYRTYLMGDHIGDIDNDRLWNRYIDDQDHDLHGLAINTLSGFHLIELIRDLDPKHEDLEYLFAAQRRLEEIATIIPSLGLQKADLKPEKYAGELQTQLKYLSETYACNLVQKYRNPDARYNRLKTSGLSVPQEFEQEPRLVAPVVINGLFLLGCCALLSLVGLHLYDALNLPRPDPPWFTVDRLSAWTSGSWVSFIMAFGFGIFFAKILEKSLDKQSPIAYLLAFIFSTLGACFFFLVARNEFKPHFVWLTINFGLLSTVTIASLENNITDKRLAIRTALRRGAWYGLASMVLSALLQLHAADWNFVPKNTVTAGAFGLLRGTIIGFFVSYVFIEFDRVQRRSDRRLSERVQVGRKVKVGWKDTEIPAYLENFSDQGAQLKVFNPSVAIGDELGLELGRGKIISGFIQWMDGNLAGVRFKPDSHAMRGAT